MKRKLSYVILICLSLLLFSSIVYAAFVMTHNYEANIGYHEITITETGLTNNVTTSDLVFNEPGDTAELKYILNNTNVSDANSKILTKNYSYHYTLSTKSTDSKLLNMIYVYQNNEYCGVLSECLKNGLLDPEYILAGETGRTSTIKFELHNGASTYVTGTVTIPVTVTCNISTVDAQKVLFADADSSNFTKIIDDINSEAGKTVVLTNALNTTAEYTIANNCTIDLCGQTLTLGANITIAPGVEVKIINSRSAGSVAGSGKFVLNSADSFIELEATLPQANLQATTYNTTRLQEELAERFVNNNIIVCGQAFDLLGSYVAYNPTVTITNGLTVTNGVVDVATTELATNQVVDVTIGGTLYEFKYIGNDDEVFASIINDDLKHLSAFANPNTNQTSNHIFLPTAINEHNATISWNSSNPEIINNYGIVQYDQGSVVLTATIKVYDKVYTKNYYIYIVQQDNLSKLQYLATRVEKGITLTNGTEVKTDDVVANVVLDNVGAAYAKPLPVAGAAYDSDIYYYTNWTDGKKLGIVDLKYEVEGSYYYISVDQTRDSSDAVLAPNVYLNQVTYSKVARVKMIGTFENGDVHEVYVTITIDLQESELADEIFEDVQIYLNSVNVLQNILNTRKESGVLNEKGDFEVPSMIDVIKLDYESLDEDLYRIDKTYKLDSKGDYELVAGKYVPSENGNYSVDKIFVRFNDLRYLGLTDEQVKIRVKIRVVSTDQNGVTEDSYPAERSLSFTTPGAITPENFVISVKDANGNVTTTPVFNMSDTSNTKRIFYSFKYQTLQQSDTPYYVVSKNVVTTENIEDKTETKADGTIVISKTTTTVNTITEVRNYLNGQVETVVNEETIINVLTTTTDKDGVVLSVDETSTTNTELVSPKPNIVNGTISLNEVYALGQYILMYDVENTERLVFEYSENAIIVDYYDLNIFEEIINWATGTGTGKVSATSFRDSIDSGLQWIPADGDDELSDGEITVILSYAERFPGFMDMWNGVVKVLDNRLSESDINNLLKTLAQDEYFVSILNWLEDSNSNNISLYQWLYMVDPASPSYNQGIANITDDMITSLSTKIKIPVVLLNETNENGEHVTNDEERVIVYYVMANYGITNDFAKYISFYSNWKESIKRQNALAESVKLINNGQTPANYKTNEINIKTFDEEAPNALYGSTPIGAQYCYDPIFVEVFNWIVVSSTNTDTKTLLSSSIQYDILNEYKSLSNDWFVGTQRGIFGTYSYHGDLVNEAEWDVLWTYLGYYGINSITVTTNDIDFTYIYKDLKPNATISECVSTVEDTDGNIESVTLTTTDYDLIYDNSTNIPNLNNILANTSNSSGLRFTSAFVTGIFSLVNDIWESFPIADYNKLVSWVKSDEANGETPVISITPWNSSSIGLSKTYSINKLDDYRIKDCISTVSYDEWYVLTEFFKSQFSSYTSESEIIQINSILVSALMHYYISSNMDFSSGFDTIGDTNYKNILSSINNTVEFDEVIEIVTNLGTSDPTLITGETKIYHDNLETLSASEIEKLAMLHHDNASYIAALNNAISAYNIPVDADGKAVINDNGGITIITVSGYDRSLDQVDNTDPDNPITDKQKLINFINKALDNTVSDKVYKYITVGQITSSDVKAFGILTYYDELLEIMFRGSSAKFLFATNADANSVFDIVANSCDSLQKLTMNYTGVSDITSLSELLNLVHLDLRGNYTTNGYEGLSDISSLILLNDLKNINGNDKIKYLNVFNTDVKYNRAEVVLATLYDSSNKTAELWFNYNGVETKYPPGNQFTTEEELAYHILSLLYEMNEMTGDYIVLPNSVYIYDNSKDANGNTIGQVKYGIKWSVVIANSLISYNSAYNRIEKLSSPTTAVDVTVSASVTIGTNTYYRYFVITVIPQSTTNN